MQIIPDLPGKNGISTFFCANIVKDLAACLLKILTGHDRMYG